MADTSPYDHREITRYLQQQMTAAEMHAFERTMMDDPFLADAVEGLRQADNDTTAQHLSHIRAAIAGDRDDHRVVPINTRKTQWWQVAALILVLAGAGLLTYRLTNPTITYDNAVQVAQAKERENNTENDSLRSSVTVENNPATENLPYKEKPVTNVSPPMIRETAPEQELAATLSRAAYDTPLIVLEDSRMAPQVQDAQQQSLSANNVVAEKKMDYSRAQAANEFVGKVMDASGEPVPFATVRAPNTNIGTVTDAEGNFKLRAPDTVLNINIQSVGYASTNVELKSQSPASKIIVHEEKQNLSEVVVTGLASRKRSAEKEEKSARPVSGWRNFNQYVSKNKDSVKVKGKVEVSFTIDANGKPSNIILTPAPANEEASKIVALLQNGPRWQPINEKVKLTLSF